MTLPKEWIDKAKQYKEDILHLDIPEDTENDFLNGATAYKQEVEKMLNNEIPNSKAQEPFIKHLLSKIQTLKPTSND